jgi:copper transport protein
LSAKLVLVCAVLAFAIVNRRLTPRAAAGESRSTQQLVRSITIELALVAVIVGLVGAWRFTPPPRSLLALDTQPTHVHIHTSKAMADLQIEPPKVVGRRITITLLDGEFRPLAAKEVVLVLSKPDAGIEPLRLLATLHEASMWRIEDVRLPMSGRWQGRIEILVSDFEKIAIEDEINLP